jgi:hypothetical protein
MKAIVLGCGPAGLLAAHACKLRGLEVEIYSIKQKSPILGAQYLQRGIPFLTGDPDGHVVFNHVGTSDGYATKVYGSADAQTSWGAYEDGFYPAWSLKNAYDELWDRFEADITDIKLNSVILSSLEERTDVDYRFSAIPVKAICWDQTKHIFEDKQIWVTRTCPTPMVENSIIYNGRPEDSWYRASFLFGEYATEFGKYMGGGLQGIKPLSTNCNCRPLWQRVGRFGKWQRGVLTHHAFEDVIGALEPVA